MNYTYRAPRISPPPSPVHHDANQPTSVATSSPYNTTTPHHRVATSAYANTMSDRPATVYIPVQPAYDSNTTSYDDASSTSSDLFAIRTLTFNDRLTNLIQSIRSNPIILPFYIALAGLNLLLMLYQLVYAVDHWTIIAIELILNTVLVVEVVVNILLLQHQFFRNYMNWLDLGLTVLCVVLFVMELYVGGGSDTTATASEKNSQLVSSATSQGSDLLGELDSVLLAVRYMFQLGRLTTLVQRSRNATERLAVPDVYFHTSKSIKNSSFDYGSEQRSNGNGWGSMQMQQQSDDGGYQ